ncbi:MAG TPA: M48 family metallopeptidase [Acidimicrobiales bacterium]|nr:M48 family metallopeptidase [Acidimicrobiales bacterium]
MRVEVVRSARRRKTVQAREVEGVLRVSIPASMSAADEARWVEEMVRRMERRSASTLVDLERRAASLAKRYGLERPESISWSNHQEWRWGSCTPATRTVRISTRVAQEPAWVLDYVIVHELAHLSVPRHDRAFWALVNRYPLTERARGFLIARGREPEHDDADGDEGVDGAAGTPAGTLMKQGAPAEATPLGRRRPSRPVDEPPAWSRQETAAADRTSSRRAGRSGTGSSGHKRHS